MVNSQYRDKLNLKQKTLADVLNGFTNNVGYPLLTASRSPKSSGISAIHIKQVKFTVKVIDA